MYMYRSIFCVFAGLPRNFAANHNVCLLCLIFHVFRCINDIKFCRHLFEIKPQWFLKVKISLNFSVTLSTYCIVFLTPLPNKALQPWEKPLSFYSNHAKSPLNPLSFSSKLVKIARLPVQNPYCSSVLLQHNVMKEYCGGGCWGPRYQ